jgi:hypothetical protein
MRPLRTLRITMSLILIDCLSGNASSTITRAEDADFPRDAERHRPLWERGR